MQHSILLSKTYGMLPLYVDHGYTIVCICICFSKTIKAIYCLENHGYKLRKLCEMKTPWPVPRENNYCSAALVLLPTRQPSIGSSYGQEN